MTGGVAGGVEDGELRPGEGEGAVHGRDDDVGGVDHAGGLPLHHAGGQGEEVALQGEDGAAHTGLRGGESHGDAVFFLKIAAVAAVIHMGVGAQNAHRGEPGFTQGLLQFLPLLHQAGVQQNAPAVVQPVEGDQLDALGDPGGTLDL